MSSVRTPTPQAGTLGLRVDHRVERYGALDPLDYAGSRALVPLPQHSESLGPTAALLFAPSPTESSGTEGGVKRPLQRGQRRPRLVSLRGARPGFGRSARRPRSRGGPFVPGLCGAWLLRPGLGVDAGPVRSAEPRSAQEPVRVDSTAFDTSENRGALCRARDPRTIFSPLRSEVAENSSVPRNFSNQAAVVGRGSLSRLCSRAHSRVIVTRLRPWVELPCV